MQNSVCGYVGNVEYIMSVENVNLFFEHNIFWSDYLMVKLGTQNSFSSHGADVYGMHNYIICQTECQDIYSN